MGRKLIKKIWISLMTVAMSIGMISMVPVYAQNDASSVIDLTKTYAIVDISSHKAIQVVDNTVQMTGQLKDDDSGNQLTDLTSLFKIISRDDQNTVGFQSVSLGDKAIKATDTLSFEASQWVTNGGGDMDFHIIGSQDDGFKIKNRGNNKYFKVNGQNIDLVLDENDATKFKFVEATYEDTLSISLKNADSGKYVTFKDQKNLETVKVNATKVTDTERFVPEYTTNDNYEIEGMSGKINVVGLKSKSSSDMVIISANWVDGAVSKILAKKSAPGGWESIVIQPAGDGKVYLRSSYTYQYVTVNDDDELVLCDKTADQLTDREKFIVDAKGKLEDIDSLEADIKNRTQTTVKLSWKDPVAIHTDVVLYQKGPQENGYTKIADVSGKESYEVTGLNPGSQYSFKLVIKKGSDIALSAESNVVSVKTRAGVKPATPTGLTLKENDGKLTLSWESAENVTHYQIQRAPSAFAEYKDIENGIVSKDKTSIEIDITGNKYENYYRVIGLNDNGADNLNDAELSDPSEYISLETELFGENVIIFAPTDDTKKIDKVVQDIFKKQNDASKDAQFNTNRYSIYYKPGDYKNTRCVPVGFYTHVGGLGKTPYDVELNNIEVPAYLDGSAKGGNYWDDGGTWRNATCNFWRSAENLSITGTGDATVAPEISASQQNWAASKFNWSVAQAAPLRRVYSTRDVQYDWSYGWASGGYTADCLFEGSANTTSGQQYFTRNSVVKGDATGTTLNNFNMGVESASLPTTNALKNGNGYSNWNQADANDNQQVITNITKTPKIKEKPFLFIDDDGEYKIFVSALRNDTSGVSWSKDNMGEGKVVSLDEFYIAKEGDSAKTINAQLEAGKNIFFTPGVYHAEEVIKVNNPHTILLGTGMASIIPDNSEGAMKVADVDDVTISGLIFDAGTHSKYLLTVGEEGQHNSHSSHPTFLQDLFFRIGGTTNQLTKADDALIINSDDVISDHFWIWRADHGAGVTWGESGNKSNHGLIVNGDNVTCYALFNEHHEEYDTLWNGENGATYFYQNEKCYDPISQEDWMSHNGTVNGYAAYKVANGVKQHYAVGLGVYNVFIYTGEDYDSSKVQIQLDSAIEVPNEENVLIENACIQTFANEDGVLQKFNAIINDVGAGVSSGIDKENGLTGEGWSRKFLISYNNGTAIVGKKPNNDQKGKYIGVETIQDVKALGDDDLDVNAMKEFIDSVKSLKEEIYTADSWKEFAEALKEAKEKLTKNGLKYSTTEEFNEALSQLKEAKKNLVIKVDTKKLQDLYDQTCDYKKNMFAHTEDYNSFVKALKNAKEVLAQPTSQKEVDEAYKLLKEASEKIKSSQKDQSPEQVDVKGAEISDKTQTSQGSHAKTDDNSFIGLYAVLAMCAAGAYVFIKKERI